MGVASYISEKICFTYKVPLNVFYLTIFTGAMIGILSFLCQIHTAPRVPHYLGITYQHDPRILIAAHTGLGT